MYGQPIPLPRNCVPLRRHQQYHVKRYGLRRSRQCADGSKQSAPILHVLSIHILPVSINPSNIYSLYYQLYLIIDCTVAMLVMPMLTHQEHIMFQLLSLLMVNMLNGITIDTRTFLHLIRNMFFQFKRLSKVIQNYVECGKLISTPFCSLPS